MTSFLILPSFLRAASSKISSMDSRLALSMKPQVLTMAMSARAASSTVVKPAFFREAMSTSPSTWFLAQPRLTMPTVYAMLVFAPYVVKSRFPARYWRSLGRWGASRAGNQLGDR